MPFLDNLQTGWCKMAECSSLLEVLHICMLVDPRQDTVRAFREINFKVTQQYIKSFDKSFVPLLLPSQGSDLVQKNTDLASSLNNRAVIYFISQPYIAFNGTPPSLSL